MDSPQQSLAQILSNPDITATQLFKTENIVPKIKAKIEIFIDFCIRNQNFTQQMIKIGLQVPQYQSVDQKKISYAAAEILTSDQDAVSQLFVIDKSKERIRLYSDDEEQSQQITIDQTTGQISILDRPSSQQKSDFIYKFRNLIFLLQYLDHSPLNENCVNYTSKVLFTIIRNKPQDIFQFFHDRMDIMKKLIQYTYYPSISFAIVKLISQADQQRFRKQKKQIIDIMLEQIRAQIVNQNFIVYLEFVEEVFNKNRFRGEQIDQIKIISQNLVQKDIVQFMVEKLKDTENNKIVICNCIAYLLRVVERMNLDEQQDPYSYSTQKNLQPTMNFAFQTLYNSLGDLIKLCLKINRIDYTPFEIFTYYQLLDGLTKNTRFAKNSQIQQNRQNYITFLLKAYLKQQTKVNGLIKGQILKILDRLISIEPKINNFSQEVTQIIQKIHKNQSREGQSYHQKIKILFNKSCPRQYIEKYTSILPPDNYNREFKVEQFNFVYQNKKNMQEANGILDNQQETGNKPMPLILEQSLEDILNNKQITVSDQQPKQVKSPNINIDFLNDKIKSLKDKKKSKSNQQLMEEQAKDNQNKEQKLQRNGKIEQQNILVPSYYVKHIVLY